MGTARVSMLEKEKNERGRDINPPRGPDGREAVGVLEPVFLDFHFDISSFMDI